MERGINSRDLIFTALKDSSTEDIINLSGLDEDCPRLIFEVGKEIILDSICEANINKFGNLCKLIKRAWPIKLKESFLSLQNLLDCTEPLTEEGNTVMHCLILERNFARTASIKIKYSKCISLWESNNYCLPRKKNNYGHICRDLCDDYIVNRYEKHPEKKLSYSYNLVEKIPVIITKQSINSSEASDFRDRILIKEHIDDEVFALSTNLSCCNIWNLSFINRLCCFKAK
ncbi:MAG: hypothetical protein HRK26_05120 [Rickettsiaceae bacterium H1]|nr:hypothetical protein [Rickettsiaceae bacterium H1]